ncbi:MAG: hypothetical protein R8G01_13390 [Ilumatobacteraceae bacterium]|nr:hypothetical protein [Ilumatobacteraceae bacterium]
MPVDDRTRLNLHRKLEAALGREEADTLMAHLPPVTWNEVATKDDLRTLETVLTSRIDGAISQAMERQIRWMVTFNTGLVALALAAARLLL